MGGHDTTMYVCVCVFSVCVCLTVNYHDKLDEFS